MVTAAGRKRGVVLTRELAAGGFDREGVQRLLAGARIFRLFRGAYSVTDPPRPLARELAALKLFGMEAALSHETAAWLFGALVEPPRTVSITHPASRGRSRPRLVVHRSSLTSSEAWMRDGLRVTSPTRTAIDIAAVAPDAVLHRVVNELIAQRHTTAARLRSAALRALPRRGSRRLLLEIDGGGVGFETKYRAENRLADLIRRSSVLPDPERNIWLYGWEVDFFWRAAGFYVEVDGGAAHSTPTKFENDRRRDAELQLHGLTGQRVTWLNITSTSSEMITRVERGFELARASAANLPTTGSF